LIFSVGITVQKICKCSLNNARPPLVVYEQGVLGKTSGLEVTTLYL
jgi:hypothetical protein